MMLFISLWYVSYFVVKTNDLTVKENNNYTTYTMNSKILAFQAFCDENIWPHLAQKEKKKKRTTDTITQQTQMKHYCGYYIFSLRSSLSFFCNAIVW